jgi:hypothetical protein
MVTEEEIAELMKTPEGMQILRSMMEDQDEGEAMTDASGYDNDAMSPEDRMAVDAMNNERTPPVMTPMPGMSPQAGGQIGDSLEAININAVAENERRMAENKRLMTEQLLQSQLGN